MLYISSKHFPLQRTFMFIILILIATYDINRSSGAYSFYRRHMGFRKA